jgi:hypothetical protein
MKRGKLKEVARELLGDTRPPYFWSDVELEVYLNEAQVEACRRARLLVDSTTAAVCQVAITIDTQDFALDPRVIMVRRAKLANESFPLTRKSQAALDEEYPGWDTDSSSTPSFYFADANSAKISLYPKADTADTLHMTVVREPLVEMNDDEDTPEIPARYHYSLLHWALHRAYMKPGSETFNDKESATALAMFEVEFGRRRSADVERFEAEHEGYDIEHGAY